MSEEVKKARKALYDQLDTSLPNGWALSELTDSIERLIKAHVNEALSNLSLTSK